MAQEEKDGGSVVDMRDRKQNDPVNGTADEDEARKSIEQLAAENDGDPEDEEGQQLLDFGDQLNLSIKGKRPTESQLKIRPVSRSIKGQLGDKGDDETYAFLVIGKMHKLEIPYSRDEAGRVIGKIRRHILDPKDVVRVTDEQAEEILASLDE